jgi:hypothetical protein
MFGFLIYVIVQSSKLGLQTKRDLLVRDMRFVSYVDHSIQVATHQTNSSNLQTIVVAIPTKSHATHSITLTTSTYFQPALP